MLQSNILDWVKSSVKLSLKKDEIVNTLNGMYSRELNKLDISYIPQNFNYESFDFFNKVSYIFYQTLRIEKKDFFEKVGGKPDNFDEIFKIFHDWDCFECEKFIPVEFYLKQKGIVYFFSEYRRKIVNGIDFDRDSYDISFKKILERHDWMGLFGSKIFINSGEADNYDLTEIGKAFQSVFLVSGNAAENELNFIISSLDFILKKFDEIRPDYQTNYARLLIEKFINPIIDGSAGSFGEANDFVKKWRNFQAGWQKSLRNEEQDEEVSEESEAESDQDSGLESESESDQDQGGQSETVFPQSSSQFPVVEPAASLQQSPANLFQEFPGTVFISPLYQAVSTNFPDRGSPYARSSGLGQSTTFFRSGKAVNRYYRPDYYRPNSCPNLGASKNTPGSGFFTRRNEVAAVDEVSEVTGRVAQLRLQATSYGNAGLFSQTLRCESDNSSQRVAQFDASVPNSGGIR